MDLNLIKTYLSGLSYQAQIDGFLSEGAPRLNDGPHGSVLGPLLFLLHRNNRPAALVMLLSFFADGVKMVFPRSQSSRLLSSLSFA